MHKIKPGLSGVEADIILIEKYLARLRKEEEKYLQLFGQDRIDEEMFDTAVAKVRQQRQLEEDKLNSLREQQKAGHELALRCHDIEGNLAELARNIDDADYHVKRKALEALDIRAIIYNDGRLDIKGILGGQLFSQMPLHSLKQYNPIRFYFSHFVTINPPTNTKKCPSLSIGEGH